MNWELRFRSVCVCDCGLFLVVMVFCDSGAADCDEGVMDLRLMSPYDIRSEGLAVRHLCLSFPYLISVCSNPLACDDVVSNDRAQCFSERHAW